MQATGNPITLKTANIRPVLLCSHALSAAACPMLRIFRQTVWPRTATSGSAGSIPILISLRQSAKTPVAVMPSAEAVSEPESVATIAPAAAPQRCVSDLGDA
jgi:hypothetical protein